MRLYGEADVRWMGERKNSVGLKRSKVLQQQDAIVDETAILWPITAGEQNDFMRIDGYQGPLQSSEQGCRKIEFTFQLPIDLPSTFQTKQPNYEVSISYLLQATLSYREIFKAPGKLEVDAEEDSGSKGCSASNHQCLSEMKLLRHVLDFIVLRTLDLKKEPQIEEEVNLVREKVLTPNKSELCCFFNCVCLKCRCCRGSTKPSSPTITHDSKGNSVVELCLKNSEEGSKVEDTPGDLEKVVVALNLEKTGFVPGEDINVAAEVRNLSRKLIRATYVAMQQTTELRFKTTDESKASSTHQDIRRGLKDIFKVSGGVVRTGDSAYYHDIIHIPPLPPTFQPADQLVGIGYLVTMGIIFEREDSPQFEVSQPITVGTTPVTDSHSPWATLVPSYSRYSHSSGEIEDYTELDCRQGRTSHVYKYYKTFWETPVT